MPTGTPHRERLDTALTDLLAKSHGSTKFREATGDSVVNVLFQYKPRSQIPFGGSGWTVVDERFDDKTPKHMTVLIANDQPYVSAGTFARELGRVLGLFNTVPDRTFVMFIDYAAQRFHPDEGNAIELIYRLKVHSDTRKYKNFVDTTLTGITDLLNDKPKDFMLYPNYPNPFNASTLINFSLPRASHVRLSIFNTLGQEVATLVNEKREAGRYEVEFQSAVGSRHLASGVYFYRLYAGNDTQTRKLLLLK
ncbi:MAG: T9SS type A sorting domain-containing protein [Bacteroidota bacterium]|nr:T9SS type A sorting domain-containing protein [Bacteroidota bacterium]